MTELKRTTTCEGERPTCVEGAVPVGVVLRPVHGERVLAAQLSDGGGGQVTHLGPVKVLTASVGHIFKIICLPAWTQLDYKYESFQNMVVSASPYNPVNNR